MTEEKRVYRFTVEGEKHIRRVTAYTSFEAVDKLVNFNGIDRSKIKRLR